MKAGFGSFGGGVGVGAAAFVILFQHIQVT